MEINFDERIRNWVFVPILFVMFLMGILKLYIGKIMKAGKNEANKVTSKDMLKTTQFNNLVARGKKLIALNSLLTSEGWSMRKRHLTDPNKGKQRV